MSDMPRRNQMLKWCEAEHKIQAAVDAVELMGADVRLTDAVILLGRARDRVADFVDGVSGAALQDSRPVGMLRPVGTLTLAMLLTRAYAVNGTWGSLEALAEYVTAQPEWAGAASPPSEPPATEQP